jgi:hypothetical protein
VHKYEVIAPSIINEKAPSPKSNIKPKIIRIQPKHPYLVVPIFPFNKYNISRKAKVNVSGLLEKNVQLNMTNFSNITNSSNKSQISMIDKHKELLHTILKNLSQSSVNRNLIYQSMHMIANDPKYRVKTEERKTEHLMKFNKNLSVLLNNNSNKVKFSYTNLNKNSSIKFFKNIKEKEAKIGKKLKKHNKIIKSQMKGMDKKFILENLKELIEAKGTINRKEFEKLLNKNKNLND